MSVKMLAARLRADLPVLLRSIGLLGKKLVGGHYTPVTIREMGAERLVAEGSNGREFPRMSFERSPQLALVRQGDSSGVDHEAKKEFSVRCDSLLPVGLHRTPVENWKEITKSIHDSYL